MLFFAFQLFAFLGLFVALAALVKPNWLRAIIAGIGGLALAFELLSVTIGGDLINYRFYTHFNLKVATEAGGFFGPQVGLVLAVLVLSVGGIYFLGQRLRRSTPPRIAFGLGLGTFLAMLVPSGILPSVVELVRIHFASEKAFQQAVTEAGLANYIPKSKLKAKPGKNIITIYLESFEIGYLQEKLAHLTPNLNRLRQQMNFYPMTQNEGGSYTIGALYTSMTGIPMQFKNHGDDVFADVIDFRLSSLPAVLDKAGYHLEYLAGKPEFAATDNMFKTMGVTVKSEKDYDPKYASVPWGLHDRDLFQIVDTELDRLYEQEQPFAYFIATISTHATDGVPDARVDATYPPQASRLERMALALDDYLGRLVDKLDASGRLENTAIYILPDHLLLSSHSRVLEDFPAPRQLFLLTNEVASGFENGATINQIHLPRIILDGAAVQHNFTTLADQLPDDPRDFLEEHKLELLRLNEAALVHRAADEEVDQEEKSTPVAAQTGEVRLLSRSWSHKNRGKPSYAFIGNDTLRARRGLNLVLRAGSAFTIEQFDTWKDSSEVSRFLSAVASARKNNHNFWVLAHDSVGKHLKAYQNKLRESGMAALSRLSGRKAYIAYHQDGYISEVSNDTDLDETFLQEGQISSRSEAIITADAKNPDKWIAHAGGVVDGVAYANFLEALDHNYAKGFRLFELDILETTDGQFVAAHDWDHWKNRARYAGEVPVDYATFMANPPLGKYTPLDMAAINRWFTAHPDAVLVTDKINQPRRFAEQFVDKDRLMMELFSFSAVEEATQLGIREILLTETLVGELVGEPVEVTRRLGAGGMAVSISTIMAEPESFRYYKEAGLKVYAFHIGGHGLMDEAFMARYGLDFAYGLYADEWRLEK